MDLKALLKHGLKAIGEQRDCKSHILIQGFLCLCVGCLGNFSVENEIERVVVYADLVRDKVLLVIKEVF